MNDLLQELVCQAHMAGQYNKSGVNPSWSEAFAYWTTEVKPNIRIYLWQGANVSILQKDGER